MNLITVVTAARLRRCHRARRVALPCLARHERRGGLAGRPDRLPRLARRRARRDQPPLDRVRGQLRLLLIDRHAVSDAAARSRSGAACPHGRRLRCRLFIDDGGGPLPLCAHGPARASRLGRRPVARRRVTRSAVSACCSERTAARRKPRRCAIAGRRAGRRAASVGTCPRCSTPPSTTTRSTTSSTSRCSRPRSSSGGALGRLSGAGRGRARRSRCSSSRFRRWRSASR